MISLNYLFFVLLFLTILFYIYTIYNKKTEHFLWTPNYVDINFQPAFSQYMYFDGYMIPVSR